MEQLLVTPDMSATIANLADQLKISKTDVLQQAISEYAEKVSKKKRLMSFAGILSKTEADNLSTAINCAFRDSAKQEFGNQKQLASASFRFQRSTELTPKSGGLIPRRQAARCLGTARNAPASPPARG